MPALNLINESVQSISHHQIYFLRSISPQITPLTQPLILKFPNHSSFFRSLDATHSNSSLSKHPSKTTVGKEQRAWGPVFLLLINPLLLHGVVMQVLSTFSDHWLEFRPHSSNTLSSQFILGRRLTSRSYFMLVSLTIISFSSYVSKACELWTL
jgi:hypothetical protein